MHNYLGVYSVVLWSSYLLHMYQELVTWWKIYFYYFHLTLQIIVIVQCLISDIFGHRVTFFKLIIFYFSVSKWLIGLWTGCSDLDRISLRLAI